MKPTKILHLPVEPTDLVGYGRKFAQWLLSTKTPSIRVEQPVSIHIYQGTGPAEAITLHGVVKGPYIVHHTIPAGLSQAGVESTSTAGEALGEAIPQGYGPEFWGSTILDASGKALLGGVFTYGSIKAIDVLSEDWLENRRLDREIRKAEAKEHQALLQVERKLQSRIASGLAKIYPPEEDELLPSSKKDSRPFHGPRNPGVREGPFPPVEG
jgi:hypothetical protein